MPRLTDEEYAALDEKWTKETPSVNFSRPGMFARQRLLLESLDTVTANYIHILAESAGKTPAQIIGAMVRKEMAARLTSAPVAQKT
jgi:hypothetical protein